MWRVFLLSAVVLATGQEKQCVPYTVDNELLACVCNSTYCDETSNVQSLFLTSNNFYRYETNKQGLRMQLSEGTFGVSNSSSSVTLTIDRTKKYQSILGFGGAFTDSAGINLKKLSPKTQERLLRAYYDPIEGSRYNLGRIPIGGTDFSVRAYTYDDVANDTSLEHFALALEDHKYKIPYAHGARKMNPTTKFFASAWSAPGWMKTNGVFQQFGYLKKEYYQVWANYLAKFADAYKKKGLEIWAITTGNEPTISFNINTTDVISMGWTPETMAEWVADHLGPALAKSASKETRVLAIDDDRNVLPNWMETYYNNKEASKYTVGTAVHWYFDNLAPFTVLDETHDLDPSKIIIMTEASMGPTYWGRSTIVSDMWDLGEQYFLNIIKHLKHWAVGWVDWNLVLNKEGGPTFNLTLNAAIVINPENDEFYKLSMYYAIAHFSKFVDRNSVRISVTDTDDVESAAFLTPSEEVVVVLYNKNSNSTSVTLQDEVKGNIELELSPLSMHTVIYKQ
ncbi:lysosomal acid glucosylceramidase-like isoform X3 [Halictus rubicundus]|uniref:lysosomal acid glucosylceramidase-like isoform X2 n=1 Tax=Halictus rubicundus TaxID=77578 RepID=UPI0040356B08